MAPQAAATAAAGLIRVGRSLGWDLQAAVAAAAGGGGAAAAAAAVRAALGTHLVWLALLKVQLPAVQQALSHLLVWLHLAPAVAAAAAGTGPSAAVLLKHLKLHCLRMAM